MSQYPMLDGVRKEAALAKQAGLGSLLRKTYNSLHLNRLRQAARQAKSVAHGKPTKINLFGTGTGKMLGYRANQAHQNLLYLPFDPAGRAAKPLISKANQVGQRLHKLERARKVIPQAPLPPFGNNASLAKRIGRSGHDVLRSAAHEAWGKGVIPPNLRMRRAATELAEGLDKVTPRYMDQFARHF